MKTDHLGIGEYKKYSVDKLLKEKPEKLPYLEPIEDEPNNFNIEINRVTVHGVRNYKLIYGEEYVIIAFYDNRNKRIASLSAFGSRNGEKPDESFYVGLGSVFSETSFRVMKDHIFN